MPRGMCVVRAVTWSSDFLCAPRPSAYSVKIVTVPEGKVLCTLPRSRVSAMEFSPAGNYLCTWELYAGAFLGWRSMR